MKRLEKILQKYGFEYQITTFGNSYFYNAPAVIFSGMNVTLYSGEYYSKEWSAFQRYCNRYGYTVKPWGGYPGCTTFTVCRSVDSAALKLYNEYSQRSVNACEKTMHLRHTGFFSGESDLEFNDRLTGIMAFYESEYLQALEKTA